MRISEYDPKYRLEKLNAKKDQDKIIISWKYKQGDSFLICVYDRRKEMNLQTVEDMINNESLSDEDIWKSESGRPIVKLNETTMLFFVSKNAFDRQTRSAGGYLIYNTMLTSGVAYGIQVYICNMEEDILKVYTPKENECQCYIPTIVRYRVSYKDKIFTGDKICTIRVEKMEGYQNGAVTYRIDGLHEGNVPEYPLAETALGKNLYILIPRKASVYLKVAEEYKQQYKLS